MAKNGVVRDVKPFKELRPAVGMKYFPKLRELGVFSNSELRKCFVLCDGEPYFLHNLRPIETYEKLFKGEEGWESEEKNTTRESKQRREWQRLQPSFPVM